MSELEKQNKYYGDVIVNSKDNDDNIDEYSTGVKWLPLYELVEFRNGKGHEKDIVNTGKYIVVNSKFISTSGEAKKYSNAQVCPLYKGDVLMVMSDLPNGRALAKCFLVEDDDKYTLNQRICALTVKDTEVLSIKFLYYVLNRNKQLLRFDNGVDQTNLRKNDILEILIPVPPIDVQNEIVRILDNFTELTTELTAKLSEEQTARKKQYEYYRDSLLSFDKTVEMKKVKLSEICQVYDGTHQTPNYTEFGVKFASVENISNPYATQKFISVDDYSKYKIKPQIGDVLMTRIGSIGVCYVIDKDEDLAYYVSLALLRPNPTIINSRYLKHYIESTYGSKELRRRTLVNAVPIKINKDDIGKILISVPPLDVQERLVEVLDNFDAICSDLNIGLPAEIEARKKQYEFYRDNLLKFIEKGETILTDRQTDRQTSILP